MSDNNQPPVPPQDSPVPPPPSDTGAQPSVDPAPASPEAPAPAPEQPAYDPNASPQQPQQPSYDPNGYQQAPQQPAYDPNGYQQAPPPPAYDPNAYQQAPQQPAYDPNAYAQQGGYVGGPGYGQAPGAYNPNLDPQAKSRIVAGILGILLGAFGVHRFYLGYTGIGVVMVCITVLSFGTLAVVSSIWGIVEGILILTRSQSFQTDASGRPLRDG